MPVLYVTGISNEIREGALGRLSDDLRAEISSIPELRLKKDDITIFFPCDRRTIGLGGEIIVDVGLLFDKPERTLEVRNQMAERITATIAKHVPRGRLLVECSVPPFDQQRSGFSQFRREADSNK